MDRGCQWIEAEASGQYVFVLSQFGGPQQVGSIAVCFVDPNTGALTTTSSYSTGLNWPLALAVGP